MLHSWASVFTPRAALRKKPRKGCEQMSDIRRNSHDPKAEQIQGKQRWGSESDLLKRSPDTSENNSVRATVWDQDPQRLVSYKLKKTSKDAHGVKFLTSHTGPWSTRLSLVFTLFPPPILQFGHLSSLLFLYRFVLLSHSLKSLNKFIKIRLGALPTSS